MNGEGEGEAHEVRLDAAADWFARMRGPEAELVRPAFKAWLADSRNAEAYAEIEQIWEESAGASVRPEACSPVNARWSWQSYALAAAFAVMALAAAVLLAAYSAGALRPGAGSSGTYASRIGQIRTIALPDGSMVTLDTASRIDVHYTAAERRIVLRDGRARFAVAHESARPFVVLARDRRVTARGTMFDVRLDPAVVEVTLFSGAVDVETEVATGQGTKPFRLTPGHKVALQPGGTMPQVVPLVADAGQWVSGLLPADGMTLADVVAEANRYSAAPIIVADPDIGRLRVSGAFRPGDAEALATRLAAALDLTVTRQSDGHILLSRVRL